LLGLRHLRRIEIIYTHFELPMILAKNEADIARHLTTYFTMPKQSTEPHIPIISTLGNFIYFYTGKCKIANLIKHVLHDVGVRILPESLYRHMNLCLRGWVNYVYGLFWKDS
jgi:hypothetical protein